MSYTYLNLPARIVQCMYINTSDRYSRYTYITITNHYLCHKSISILYQKSLSVSQISIYITRINNFLPHYRVKHLIMSFHGDFSIT